MVYDVSFVEEKKKKFDALAYSFVLFLMVDYLKKAKKLCKGRGKSN
jgi:hypothetical protein